MQVLIRIKSEHPVMLGTKEYKSGENVVVDATQAKELIESKKAFLLRIIGDESGFPLNLERRGNGN